MKKKLAADFAGTAMAQGYWQDVETKTMHPGKM